MSNVLIHKDRFPGVVDTATPDQVGPNVWLKEHVFQGGSDGQLLVWNSAQSDKAAWTSSLVVRDAALGNAANGLSNLLLSQNIDDGSGDFLCVHGVDNVGAGASTRNVFEIRRDGGVRFSDYVIIGPQFLNSNGGPIFGAAQSMLGAFSDLGVGDNYSVIYLLSNGVNTDLLHMDKLAVVDPDGTLHGSRVFTFDAFGRATALLEWVAPYFVGGTAVASGVEIRATHGIANSSSSVRVTTGNDGATLAIYVDNSGHVGIGGITNPATSLEVLGAEQRLRGSGSNIAYWGFYDSNGTTRRGTVGNVSGDIWLNSDTGLVQIIAATGLKITGSLGFFGTTPIAQRVLATGAGRTVDDVITALQAYGLVKQS